MMKSKKYVYESPDCTDISIVESNVVCGSAGVEANDVGYDDYYEDIFL